MTEYKENQSVPEMEKEYRSGGPVGFLAGLVLGGLAGAGAMLLIAPQSGKRTMEDLKEKSIELRDHATETVDDAVAKARSKSHHFTNSVRRQANHMQQRGQEILDEQKKHMTDAVETGKMAVEGSK
jgi:gas vesicle protein